MSLAVLLEDLGERRIELSLEGDRLRYKAPEGALTPALRERIGARRDELIRHLRGLPPEVPEVSRVPAASVQEGLWYFDQLQGPNFTYNIPVVLRLGGRLEPGALRDSVADLVARHQSLRCGFEAEGGELQMVVRRELPAPWSEIDLSALDEREQPAALQEAVREVAAFCFALDTAPLLRVRLVRLAPENHVLVLNVHHIVADGWSIGLITQELAAGYQARLGGRRAALPALPWDYSDWVAWQRQLQGDGAMEADFAFWRERMAGAPAVTTFPPDLPRPAEKAYSGSSLPMGLEAAVCERLRVRSKQYGVSVNQLALVAVAVLLRHCTGGRDLVLGLPLANRARRACEGIVGMFVSVVPLRLRFGPEASLQDVVALVKQGTAEAMAHSHLPFGRGAERHQLSQVAYNFLPPVEPLREFGGLRAESLELPGDISISKLDVTFYLEEKDGAIVGHVEYADRLYRRDTVERWIQLFRGIAEALAVDAPEALEDLSCLRGEAVAPPSPPVARGRETALPAGSPWERFERTARSAPAVVAAEEPGRRLTFAELARQATALSARLAEAGVGRGDRVGLLLPRGCDYLVAMLAVVRRAAVFVPLDAAQPAERLARMFARARLGAVVCPAGGTQSVDPAVPTIALSPELGDAAADVPALATGLEDPLYMIFTSGSTGHPKAVEVPWRGLCNLVQSHRHMYSSAERVRCSQIASVSFDASLFEIWPPLFDGGTIVFVPEDLKIDPVALRDWIVAERIVVHYSPTPLAEELLALAWPEGTALRLLTTGGQQLRRRPAAGAPFRVANNYGPTEFSVVATWGFVEPATDAAGMPPIGRPLDNVRLAILDGERSRVAPGEVGELYLHGPNTALGYFGDAEATAQSFVELPGEAPGLWYRTGDLVRAQDDGQLEYVGRADRQLKLRGYRIEPGEIESALLAVPGVRQAAVRLEGEQLVAYVEGDGCSEAEIRGRLATALPRHMVPARVVGLDRLPRQVSGKIDLASLPPLEAVAATEAPSAESTGELQVSIARAWESVLGRPVRNFEENFVDAGGHSLLLVRLKEAIRRETGESIAVMELFRNPTVARQAAFLAHGSRPAAAASAPVAAGEVAPAQARRDIAIIGMAGRFPEADSVEAFWENLRRGRDSIRRFSREELLAAGVAPEVLDHPDYVPANGILRDIEHFDAEFFGVPAHEAEVMDPQQRALLEEAWHVFEDAGYDPAKIGGRVGVYVGCSLSGYLFENVMPRRDVVDRLGGFAVIVHNEKDLAAARLSYKLDLRGPSVSVNTACSTSLAAVHQAVTALRDGQCELALAGGACVQSRQADGYLYEEGGIHSRDGACRAFDAEATGMVGGNGVALVLLKPLEAALADGDTIHAVIRGIAANNDGANKIGFTAPAEHGQAGVVADALARAGVDPMTVHYVETHGTGTRLGDSIEVAALAANYAPEDRRPAPLYLGSLKTNIGHLDTAAGATGLIKTALCLRERSLVPSLHFRTPNPQIRWPGDRFRVCTRVEPLGNGAGPRRAAVSSFGIGGTNVHAILEEPPARPERGGSGAGGPVVLPLSGRSPAALAEGAARLAAWLGRHPEARLADVAHTLAFGRRHWASRRSVCAATPAEATALLTSLAAPAEPVAAVAFMFAGMGSEKPGVARALYPRSAVFRDCIDECSAALEPVLGLDLRTLLLASPADANAAARMAPQRIAQPVVFVVEYALARFWMSLGVVPSVLIGHSAGEWVAATIAGVFALPDALRLIALRGELMGSRPAGAMLALNLGEREVVELLPPGLDIATVNAVDQVVVAGPAAEVESFAVRCEARGVRCRRLQVTMAAHSRLMDPILDAFRAAVAAVPRHAPAASLTVISNVTGLPLGAERIQEPAYWTEHLRSCVRFSDGLASLWAIPGLALLDCGPARSLCNLALRDARRPAGRTILSTLDGADAPETDLRRVLESAGTLWAAGVALDLRALASLQPTGRRISLPGYAFQRQRYWLEALPAVEARPVVATAARPVAVVRSPEMQAGTGGTDAEERVLAVMRALLGPVSLDVHSDFFLCGGDSLLAIRLTMGLNEAFGARLSRAAVMEARTPARLAALLGEHPLATPAAEPTAGCVVRLASGDDRLPPIVLVHAVGGGAFIYRELLRALGLANPVYGLQSPGLWKDEPPIVGLRQQAEHYHRALLRAGVGAPLMLAGSSYGGLVCYELDRLYRGGGHAAPVVALFDSPGPGHMPTRLEDEADVCAYLLSRDSSGRSFGVHRDRMRRLDHGARLQALLEGARASYLPHGSEEDMERLLRVLRQNLANMWDWAPAAHAARLLFFKAGEDSALLAATPELAWVPLAPAGIEIVPTPGDHSSMLSNPHVASLARELNRRLSAAQVAR